MVYFPLRAEVVKSLCQTQGKSRGDTRLLFLARGARCEWDGCGGSSALPSSQHSPESHLGMFGACVWLHFQNAHLYPSLEKAVLERKWKRPEFGVAEALQKEKRMHLLEAPFLTMIPGFPGGKRK